MNLIIYVLMFLSGFFFSKVFQKKKEAQLNPSTSSTDTNISTTTGVSQ